jgi:hypothetical protein
MRLAAAVPGLVEERVKAATLVQDAGSFLKQANWTKPSGASSRPIKIDPQNQPAYYYANLINEARFNIANHRRDVSPARALLKSKRPGKPAQPRQASRSQPYARTNLIYTSKGRQAIHAKLDRIRMDSVRYDGLPLGEVVINLSEEARKRDPERRGINFIINPNVDGLHASCRLQQIDPTTGLPLPVRPDAGTDRCERDGHQNQPSAHRCAAGRCAGRDCQGGGSAYQVLHRRLRDRVLAQRALTFSSCTPASSRLIPTRSSRALKASWACRSAPSPAVAAAAAVVAAAAAAAAVAAWVAWAAAWAAAAV